MSKVQITLTDTQLEWVDKMAAEEAQKRGADPGRYRSTFIGKLIADEHKRRERRLKKAKSSNA